MSKIARPIRAFAHPTPFSKTNTETINLNRSFFHVINPCRFESDGPEQPHTKSQSLEPQGLAFGLRTLDPVTTSSLRLDPEVYLGSSPLTNRTKREKYKRERVCVCVCVRASGKLLCFPLPNYLNFHRLYRTPTQFRVSIASFRKPPLKSRF